jgi:hypothetical protein
MPRKSGKVPAYCLHKASHQAVVRIDGRDHYLGLYGGATSHELSERLVAQWRVQCREHGGRPPKMFTVNQPSGNLSVEEMLGLYWRFAKTYYVYHQKTS